MNPSDVLRADAIVRRIEDVPDPVGVEVGVASGKLSVALLRRSPVLRLVMVDSYAPESRQPRAYRETGDQHAHCTPEHQDRTRRIAEARVRPFGARAELLVMDSEAAAARTADGSCAFVFLDADHSYEGVSADLRAWWPKVRPGGWLCGHDYDGYALVRGERRGFGVTAAVDEFRGSTGREVELDADHTWFIGKAAA